MCGGQRIAHLAGKRQGRRRQRRCRSEGKAPAGGDHAHHAGADASRHCELHELLIQEPVREAERVVIENIAHILGCDQLPVDGDRKAAFDEAGPFQDKLAARRDRPAHRAQRRNNLQRQRRRAADHPHVARARQLRHNDRQLCARGVHRPGPREGAVDALIILRIELHQRAAREAVARQHDHLTRVGRSLRRAHRRATRGDTHQPREFDKSRQAEHRPVDLEKSARRRDPDRPFHRQRCHQAIGVVARAQDRAIEHVVVGLVLILIHQRDPADGDRARPFHEPRAQQIEDVRFTRLAVGQAIDHRHNLQRRPRARRVGLGLGRRVAERFVELPLPIHKHVEEVRSGGPLPAIENVEIRD